MKRNASASGWSQPAELRRMMQGLVAALDRHQAVYPVDPASKSPLKPKLP